MFRHPVYSEAAYAELYLNGSSEIWEPNLDREDFCLIRRCVQNHPQYKKILDVGCYTGALLGSFPKDRQLYGVEINERAAAIAASRGIKIVAGSFEEVPQIDETFDLIIGCDVIEHVLDPLSFMRRLRTRLRQGGRLVLTTGDADTWLWRLVGSNFWYCFYPEHISFVGSAWFRKMAGFAQLEVVEITSFNYMGIRPWGITSIASMLGALVYASIPNVLRASKMLLRGPRSEVLPPGRAASKDHICCELKAI